MIFDKLCGLVERHIPELRQYVYDANIFEWDGDLSKYQVSYDNFFLPFRTIAIEDNVSSIILRDWVEDQNGMDKMRTFVVCLPMEQYHGVEDRASGEAEFKASYGLDYKGVYFITKGDIDQEKTMLSCVWACTKERLIAKLDSMEAFERNPYFEVDRDTKAASNDVRVAMRQIAVLNDPELWVLESTPAKIRKPAKNRLLRSGDRAIFTIKDAVEIRKRMGTTGSNDSNPSVPGSKKSPHPRRKHVRVLRSEHWGKNKDKRIIIPAAWVGPVESIHNGRRYRVRLDI